MAESNIQINALPQATLPLSDDDIFHCKQGIVDKRVTLTDLLQPHTSRTDNPHSVTKAQVGLGSVTNDPQLIKAQNLADVPNKATARTNLDVYSKAESTAALAAHTSRVDNPHKTTKDQVGLGNVTNDPQLIKAQNLSDVPNKATARANLDIYSKSETSAALTAHTIRKDNPHTVTKAQVGLGSVTNEAQLVKAQNLSDLADKTVARTNLDVYSKSEVTVSLTAHTSRVDNPHKTTKDQVGLGSVTNEAQLVKAQNLADLPDKAKSRANLDIYSKAEATAALSGHANRVDNPHKTTKDQVGLGNVPNYGASQSYTESSSSSFATAKAVNDLFKMIQGMYPVGHRIYTENSANPSTYIPIGTWVLTGKGKVSVGYDPANTARPVGTFFGASTMTLQSIHLAAHQHSVTVTGGDHGHNTTTDVSSNGNHQHLVQGNTGLGGAHRHTAPVERADDGLVGPSVIRGVAWGGGIQWNTTNAGTSDSVEHSHWFSVLSSWEGTHTHTVNTYVKPSGNLTLGGVTTSTGNGQAFGIEQPSEVIYIWKRTA